MAGTVVVDTVKSSTTSAPTFQNTSGTEIGTLCRAWVNFNGMGTVAIRSSFNVSSITDNGTGDYTVNFINAMPDTNYSTVLSAGRNGVNNDVVTLIKSGGTYSTSAVQILSVANSNYSATLDADPFCVAIFR